MLHKRESAAELVLEDAFGIGQLGGDGRIEIGQPGSSFTGFEPRS
jgi:hypothetical protein